MVENRFRDFFFQTKLLNSGILLMFKDIFLHYSYGFTTDATVGSSTTHLSNQNYNICIRRAAGYCYICYSPTIAGAALIAQISFGLGYVETLKDIHHSFIKNFFILSVYHLGASPQVMQLTLIVHKTTFW